MDSLPVKHIKNTVQKQQASETYPHPIPSTHKVLHALIMFSQALLLLLSFTPFSSQAPVTKRAFSNGPVITSDFPDPAFINVGGTYYAFATSNGKTNVQMATSPDFDTWTVTGGDALPNIPSWSTGTVWAPDVIQVVGSTLSSVISRRLTITG